MVEYHEQKWKKYAEGEKLKSTPFWQWRRKALFGDSIFPGSPVAKKMTRLELFLELFPRDELNLIDTVLNLSVPDLFLF